ncbi:MAG: hypothetical protein ACFFDN_23365 [Candidatus Hodarchaeota archaeon]
MPLIKIPPPGPKSKKIIDMDQKYICNSTKISPIVAEIGKKCILMEMNIWILHRGSPLLI